MNKPARFSRPNRTTVYINTRTSYGVETVDEYPKGSSTYANIAEDLRNYNISDWANSYYRSNRCTKEWRNK